MLFQVPWQVFRLYIFLPFSPKRYHSSTDVSFSLSNSVLIIYSLISYCRSSQYAVPVSASQKDRVGVRVRSAYSKYFQLQLVLLDINGVLCTTASVAPAFTKRFRSSRRWQTDDHLTQILLWNWKKIKTHVTIVSSIYNSH